MSTTTFWSNNNLYKIASACSIDDAVADVEMVDESHGLYGEVVSSDVVHSALARLRDIHENVGKLDDPTNAKLITTLHSLSYTPSEMIVLEIDNTCLEYSVRVRYFDSRGNTSESKTWTIQPLSTMVQYSQSGYIYILTAIQTQRKFSSDQDSINNDKENKNYRNEMDREIILGAYRPIRSLPSSSPHCILVQQQQQLQEDGHHTTRFLVENMLVDESNQDSLVVAAAILESGGERPLPHGQKKKTLSILRTIIQNLIDHPMEEKYHTLRLSNRTIQHYICPCWGAMRMLQILGFGKTKSTNVNQNHNKEKEREDFLLYLAVTDNNNHNQDLLQRAKQLLELLETRNDPHFVAELEPSPPPWYRPALVAAPGTDHRGNLSSHWNTQGTHFITPEERWARIERVQQWKNRGRRGWT